MHSPLSPMGSCCFPSRFPFSPSVGSPFLAQHRLFLLQEARPLARLRELLSLPATTFSAYRASVCFLGVLPSPVGTSQAAGMLSGSLGNQWVEKWQMAGFPAELPGLFSFLYHHPEHLIKCHEQLMFSCSVGPTFPGLAPGTRAEEVDLIKKKQEGPECPV